MDKKSEFLNAFRSIIMNSNSRWGGGELIEIATGSPGSLPARQDRSRFARVVTFCRYFYEGALKVEIEMMKATRNEK